MHEIEIQSLRQLNFLVEKMSFIIKSIPIFIQDKTGEIHIIPANVEDMPVESPFQLVYLGKVLSDELLAEMEQLDAGNLAGAPQSRNDG